MNSIHWIHSEEIVSLLNHLHYPILIITGPSGAGKSYLSSHIVKHNERFSIVKNWTTRTQRLSDDISQFNYISDDAFNQIYDAGNFFLARRGAQPWYGYHVDEIKQLISRKQIPLFMFRQGGVEQLGRLIDNLHIIVLQSDVSILPNVSHDTVNKATVESSQQTYDSIYKVINERTNHMNVIYLNNTYDDKLLNHPELISFLSKIN